MLLRRISAGIIVKDSIAVQSFGFSNYLPIGDPSITAKNYDRWSADEILVMDISRSRCNLGPDFNMIESIGKINILTPLIYSGAVSSVEHATTILACGFERIAITQSFLNSPSICEDIASTIGAQALIIALPFKIIEDKIVLFDYLNRSILPFPFRLLNRLYSEGAYSELLLMSVDADGYPGSFRLPIDSISLDSSIPILLHGGLDSNTIRGHSSLNNIAAYFLSNPLLYKEHAIQTLKNDLKSDWHRPASYSSNLKY